MRPDALDLPSGTLDPKGRELSFRELSEYYARDNRSWDMLWPSTRLKVEQSRDPTYKPIQPGEGNRARRKQRRG